MTGIGTDGFYNRSIGSLASLRARAETLQTQIASKEKLQRSSDDAVASRQLRALGHDDTLAAVHKTNAAIAGSDMALADQALTELGNLTMRVQELATQSATGTLNPAQRKINGDEIAQIHQSMVAILNSKDSTGHPLFAGSANGPAYVVAADGSASYAGNSTPGELDVGAGITVARSLTGPEFMNFSVDGTDTDLLTVVHNLATSLQSGSTTAASDANAALKGLTAGLGAISTGHAIIGARESRVEIATSLVTERGEVRAGDQIRLGGTDMPTAIAELQELMTVLEASQASFTKLSSLSLFDYFR